MPSLEAPKKMSAGQGLARGVGERKSPDRRSGSKAGPSLSEHIEQNIDSIYAIQRREWDAASPSQRHAERFARLIGRPAGLVSIVVFIALWIAANLCIAASGGRPFDPPPFALLDGLVSLLGLIIATIVLIAQNRAAKLEQQHTHLDLQVNLLTEQKVTKLIHLIEELRRDLPMVKDRHDPQATMLQEAADTAEVLSAIEQTGLIASMDGENLSQARNKNPPDD